MKGGMPASCAPCTKVRVNDLEPLMIDKFRKAMVGCLIDLSYMLRWFGGILLVFMTFASGCVVDEPERSVVEVGDRLPEFSVVMNDGEMLSTEMLRGGESMIVLFTTTCSDCRRELPRINAYAAAHPEVRVVCIARSQMEAEIRSFWQAEGLNLPYSPQKDASVYHLFATSGVPRVYCADSRLCVTAVYFEQFPF